MKLKEYPKSLYSSLKLLLTPINKLGNCATPAHVPLIVSLTSIPSRLNVLSITIRSLLNQTVLPEKIILWLNSDLRGSVPQALQRLESTRFEIRFKPGHSSHRKLVFALNEFPSHTLVTCDDDLIYPEDWLERLLIEHGQNPNVIVAHECRNIAYDDEGNVLPYKNWKSTKPGESTTNTLAIGYGGTLYPPHALDPETIDKKLYLQLTPKADDLWFKAMAMKRGTPVLRSQLNTPKPTPIVFSQKFALGHTNIRKDGNRSQWQAILDYYKFPTNNPSQHTNHD